MVQGVWAKSWCRGEGKDTKKRRVRGKSRGMNGYTEGLLSCLVIMVAFGIDFYSVWVFT